MGLKDFINKFSVWFLKNIIPREINPLIQEWIFNKIDEDALNKQGKLKIWVKNTWTNENKYCTGSWINVNSQSFANWAMDLSTIDWKTEINELLAKWWDGSDMSDSIKNHISTKYGLNKTANELSSINSDDLFDNWISQEFENSTALTLSNDEIPMDKKELWNERNELLNKVKSLPSWIYKEGPDYDLINKTIAVINQDWLEEDEFYNYELFVKADNWNIVLYPDPYMVQLFITDTGEWTDISDEYNKCSEIPWMSAIQNNWLTKEQFEYVNKYAVELDYDALFEKQRKERPAAPWTFVKINSLEVPEKIRDRARNIKRRAVSWLEKEKDAW